MPTRASHLTPVDELAAPAGVTRPSGADGAGHRFLTDVIVELGFASAERVEQAVKAARVAGRPPEQLLLEQDGITEEQLGRAVAERLGLDFLDLSEIRIDMAAATMVPPAVARRYELVPVSRSEHDSLLVAMVDPTNVVAIDDVAIRTGLKVRPAVATREDVASAIAEMARLDSVVSETIGEEELDVVEITDLHEAATETPIIKLVNSLLGQAVSQGASDVHFEPGGGEMRVRLRIDGVLNEVAQIPARMIAGTVSRIKIMADLDISERRLPQDGRLALTIDGTQIDIRIVTLPSVHGESVVMRILHRSDILIDLERLGLQDSERGRVEAAIRHAHGSVLVTGPTGSGKSTTLYAALNSINTPEKNIVTIEDPVEYQLEGITQVQVNPRAGLTFAAGLRSMMRADPDIIMVGEIRDRETAQISVEAALTGHLVLSTLHTNDAPSSITRLVEMGVEPFLVASSIRCIVAQRLARLLCPNCKKRVLLDAETLRDAGFPAAYDVEGYSPVGCSRCSHSGYRGRIGIFEVMPMSDELRNLTLERGSADRIAEVATSEGMRSLRQDGFEKIRLGLTSVDEVVRVVGT